MYRSRNQRQAVEGVGAVHTDRAVVNREVGAIVLRGAEVGTGGDVDSLRVGRLGQDEQGQRHDDGYSEGSKRPPARAITIPCRLHFPVPFAE